jgi:hypothetical protein
MKWKEAFKRALAFNTVKNFFESASPPLISEEGEKYLQKQNLIKMMEHDEEAGLYKTVNMHMIDDSERAKYEQAIALGKCDDECERKKMIERVGVLLKYRGAMAQQLLDSELSDDEELYGLLKHMYQHYDDLIKQSLGL